MDPVSLIVEALLAGVGAGLSESAQAAVSGACGLPSSAAAARAREFAKVWGTTALVADVDRLAASWPPPGSALPWPDVPAALCLVAGTLLSDR